MKRIIVGFSLFCALSGLLKAQAPTVQRAEDEFPGVQVLPPGSVVTGLSLPRYENHKVTAFMKADELRVISRSKINITNIRAALYDDNGETTSITCKNAGYDFKKKVIVADMGADVVHPNFTLSGVGVTFSTAGRIGFIKGPVHTTIRSAKKNKKK